NVIGRGRCDVDALAYRVDPNPGLPDAPRAQQRRSPGDNWNLQLSRLKLLQQVETAQGRMRVDDDGLAWRNRLGQSVIDHPVAIGRQGDEDSCRPGNRACYVSGDLGPVLALDQSFAAQRLLFQSKRTAPRRRPQGDLMAALHEVGSAGETDRSSAKNGDPHDPLLVEKA